MDAHIVCPYQTTENFDLETCMHCSKIEINYGGSLRSTTIRCRNQKTKRQKKDWEMIFYERRANIPLVTRTKIIVDGPSHKKG